MNYKVGDKIKFKTEKQRYTIRACNNRFIIATKPFNAQKTFIYTLVDLEEKQRAADNYYCKYDYEKRHEAEQALKELMKTVKMREGYAKEVFDDFWLSSRSRMELDLERIDFDKRSVHVYTDINDIYGEYSSITDEFNKVFKHK